MKKVLFILLFLNSLFCVNSNAQDLAFVLPLDRGTDSKSNIVQNISYYPNGRIKEIRKTKNNQLHGTWKYFYMNGQLKKEGTFTNNKPTGKWKIYDLKGNILFIENYVNGIEDGIWKAFYPNNILKIEGTFINGKRQGLWKIYDSSGILEKKVTFENDREKTT